MNSYYSRDPDILDRAGDIWRQMQPDFRCWAGDASALVISPACDLANNKCEWVSFVPVVPIRAWLLSRSFWRDVVALLKESVAALDLLLPIELEISILSAAHDKILRDLGGRVLQAKSKKEGHRDRVLACIKVLHAQLGYGVATIADVKNCFANNGFEKLIRSISKNSYRGDLHFLPADGRAGPYSVVEEDSVCLFRYVFSRPIELLALANDRAVTDWSSAVQSLRRDLPMILFGDSASRPLKVGSLTKVVHSDLVARFVSNQVRLGIPDLNDIQLNAIHQRIAGA